MKKKLKYHVYGLWTPLERACPILSCPSRQVMLALPSPPFLCRFCTLTQKPSSISTFHLAAIAVHAKDALGHGKLLLSETDSLLDSNGEFLIERLECLIRWQVETVEAVHLVSCCCASKFDRLTYHVCDFGN